MKFSHSILAISVALSLTACGGGTSQTEAPSTASAAPAELASADTLPAFRTALQNSQSNAAAPLAPQYLATITSSLVPAASVGAINDRAMWTWYDADIATSTKQNKMLNFALSKKVNYIFIHSQTLLSKPTLLAGFLNRAAAKGIKVELLFGAPEWALSANHQVAIDLLKKANAFVAGLSGARPSGIHFDIEPHALAEWNTDPVSLGNQLLDLYGKMAATKAAGLYINADIAMGYEYVTLTRNGVTKTLSQWMVDATDRTTLMDYRDYSSGEDSIESHASHPIAYAASHGKQTIVGVETTCNVQPTKVTFCEEGSARMENELANVNAYFSMNGGFGGVAIHDYPNFAKLAP